MNIQDVLSRFKFVKQERDGYLALCPAHKDKNPSLSIIEGDGGRILLNCFAGCQTKDILKSVGLKMSDLFSEEPLHPCKHKQGQSLSAQWQSILSQYTNRVPIYRLFTNRKISEATIDKAFTEGKIRFFKHRGKNSVACVYTKLNGNKSVLSIQALTVDGSAFTHADGSKVFVKGSQAGGDCFFQAGADIEKAETIILCEAVIDALSCADCLPEACILAIGGTSLSKKVKALRSYRDSGKTIICFFDNDAAGRKATQAVAKILGVKTQSVEWSKDAPDGQDINDLLKLDERKTIIEMVENALIERSSKQKSATSNFSARVFSEALIKKYKLRSDRYKRFWLYDTNTGLWTEDAEQTLEFTLRKELLPEKYLSRYYIREVLSDTKSLVFDRSDPTEPAPDIVPFSNGVFNLPEDRLEKYKPELFFTNQLPIKYEPGSKCPLIEKIFSELVADPNILFELCAYCLFRGYPYSKWFFLYGSGGNGKSLFTNILAKMLGHKNVKSLSPQDLQGNRFASAGLFGKLANISGEISYQRLERTDVLKRLVGNDLIKGECKFKSSFDFINHAKLIFNTNELPATNDQTRAFYRRLYLIEFPNRFEGKLEDKALISKITKKEFEGLAVKSLEYLKTFINRGYYFTADKSIEQLQAKYDRLTNPLSVFLDERTKQDYDGYIAKWNFRDDFINWLKEKAFRILSEREITQSMKSKGFEEKLKDFDGKRARAWVGLSWKDTTVFENGII